MIRVEQYSVISTERAGIFRAAVERANRRTRRPEAKLHYEEIARSGTVFESPYGSQVTVGRDEIGVRIVSETIAANRRFWSEIKKLSKPKT